MQRVFKSAGKWEDDNRMHCNVFGRFDVASAALYGIGQAAASINGSDQYLSV